MKTLLRNDLWLSLIAYSLFLYGFEVLGLIVCVLCITYLVIFNNSVNFWRVVSISIIFASSSCWLVSLSNISQIYPLIYPFLILANINASLLGELFNRVSKEFLLIVYVFLFGTMAISALLVFLMPDIPFIPYIKTDMYAYIVVLFVPTFFNINVSLLKKVHHHKMAKA